MCTMTEILGKLSNRLYDKYSLIRGERVRERARGKIDRGIEGRIIE